MEISNMGQGPVAGRGVLSGGGEGPRLLSREDPWAGTDRTLSGQGLELMDNDM